MLKNIIHCVHVYVVPNKKERKYIVNFRVNGCCIVVVELFVKYLHSQCLNFLKKANLIRKSIVGPQMANSLKPWLL